MCVKICDRLSRTSYLGGVQSLTDLLRESSSERVFVSYASATVGSAHANREYTKSLCILYFVVCILYYMRNAITYFTSHFAIDKRYSTEKCFGSYGYCFLKYILYLLKSPRVLMSTDFNSLSVDKDTNIHGTSPKQLSTICRILMFLREYVIFIIYNSVLPLIIR